MSGINFCDGCAPEGCVILDIIENPFATCERCGISADDVGAILEVE